MKQTSKMRINKSYTVYINITLPRRQFE